MKLMNLKIGSFIIILNNVLFSFFNRIRLRWLFLFFLMTDILDNQKYFVDKSFFDYLNVEFFWIIVLLFVGYFLNKRLANYVIEKRYFHLISGKEKWRKTINKILDGKLITNKEDQVLVALNYEGRVIVELFESEVVKKNYIKKKEKKLYIYSILNSRKIIKTSCKAS